MADPEHLQVLHNGISEWNEWMRTRSLAHLAIKVRSSKPLIHVPGPKNFDFRRCDLTGADLRSLGSLRGINLYKADLKGANLEGVNLSKANLRKAHLDDANLQGAILDGAKLENAQMIGASLKRASMRGAEMKCANLCNADLYQTDLSHAKMNGVWFRHARLIQTRLKGADISHSRIYGISAWDVDLQDTKQQDLLLTPKNQPDITVDNLEVAQFVYIILHNDKIKNVIDTVARKAVLILGRFTPARKAVLHAIKDVLRQRGFLPILFDFSKPESRDYIESVLILAHMCKFVVADFSDSKIVLEEAPHIVRNVAVPFAPIMSDDGVREPVTLYNLRINHRSVLPTIRYSSTTALVKLLDRDLLPGVEKCHEELRKYRDLQ